MSFTFLGRKVCDDVHAFLKGTAPAFAPGRFAVGPSFRVERAKNGNGSNLWEYDPHPVLHFLVMALP
jgi:hypothetical protein